ncbi:uncharacterized protein B0P05DRAFT_72267 [Gilbertella persicaria]|uniref:uncharacterized protein n=1 Tax=Gilbertella persicaria TaxID=101096 RepID=UPI002220E7B6|nr:uncharacterized protein B0P05DRAFT_72267 [Gilbertella persicaria]KAI8080754.1 hypothetical protein B0P05DRAFT_72267 [Gilbertella persicaria]
MSSWSTLNKGVTTLKEDAVELQVEKLLGKYQDTLKLHQKGQIEEAKLKYEELVGHELLKKEMKPTKKMTGNTDRVEETPLSTLRFLVFKNYASILKDEFLAKNDTRTAEKALKNYLQAAKIDPTERSLWYHIGSLAQVLKKYRFARLAYEIGFYVDQNERILKLPLVQLTHAQKTISSSQFTPMQWKCFEGLCQVLYEIGDYQLCTFYVDFVLEKHKNWSTGIHLKSKMNGEIERGNNTEKSMEIDSNHQVSIVLEKYDWTLLIRALLKEYKHLICEQNNTRIEDSALNRLTGTKYANHQIQITVEKEEEEQATLDVQMEENQIVATLPSQSGPAESLEIIPTTVPNDSATTEANLENATNDESSNKRKREEDEDDTNIKHPSGDEQSENDNEEDEAEEKRLSLRTFKRQRDKIANEETSRLKMLEEEKIFDNKVQTFYDQMKIVPDLSYQNAWQNTTASKQFWDWFDLKVTELDSSYCWDIDNAFSTIGLESSKNTKRAKSLALYIPSCAATEENPDSKLTVKHYIAQLNQNNSGIVDSLCKAMYTLIYNDLHVNAKEDQPRTKLSHDTLNLVTDTIALLDLNFVECILSNTMLSKNDKIGMIMRVGEYFMDRLIRKEMSAMEENVLQSPYNNNKRKVSTSLSKQSKIKTLEAITDNTEFWIELFEQQSFSLSLEFFQHELGSILSNDERTAQETINSQLTGLQLRYWSLKGKMAQCRNDIENAYACFSKCKLLVESSSKPLKLDLGSMYDSIIDVESIERKLELLQVGKLFATAKQKMNSDDYVGVIHDIEDIVKAKIGVSFDALQLSDEDVQMAIMLAKAYFKSDKFADAWNCYVSIFCCLLKQLISYGCHQLQNNNRPCKNDDTEFLKMLGQINHTLDALVLLVSNVTFQDWLPARHYQEFLENLNNLLKMSIYYMFRHPDFVPFVNNFSSPDVPPHTPSKITKSNSFNEIIIKGWVLQSHLFQQAFKKTTNESIREVKHAWAELLHSLHDELGEREVCGVAKSIFLQHVMDTLVQVDDVTFRREIYQCYHCLYGVHLAAESDMIEEHYCAHSELDKKASEPLFALVADASIEKLKNGILLKNDLKDVVETVSTLFSDLPTRHPLIKNNQRVIDDYLNSSIEFRSSLDVMLRDAIIPANPIDPSKTNTSAVYYKIFWIRGKTFRIQLKSRSKATNEKLENAIEEYMSHLVLNPNDAEAWRDVALCYQYLAEIELNWSAANITTQKELLNEYQRKSFHAYMRALYLGNFPRKDEAKNEFFSDFGSLLCSIASPPMNMEPFKGDPLQTLGKDGKLVGKQSPLPPVTSVYKLSLVFFNRALRYKAPDHLRWRCYYMTGKCLAKISRPPKEVLSWYLKSVSCTKFKNERKEQESVYVFYSALVKYLYQGKIDAQTVESYISAEHSLKKANTTNVDQGIDQNIFEPTYHEGSLNNNQLMIPTTNLAIHLPSDVAHAYDLILQRLMSIRSIDSKTWFHNAIYRIAWMYFYVYRHPEKAKNELTKLFTLNKTVKNHIVVWEQGSLELPGKRYTHVDKYTHFFIKISKEVNDQQTLKNLYRKLRRGQGFIINAKKIFREAYSSYLQMIQFQLNNTYNAQHTIRAIQSSRIQAVRFEAMCSTFVKAFNENKSQTNAELHGFLQDLSELKRLTHGYIANIDVTQDGLDDTIQLCFAVVAFGDIYKLQEIQDAVAVEGESMENHHEKLMNILSTQAKVLMQNTVVATR